MEIKMEFLKTLLNLLELEMDTPPSYGWFHILWLVITVAAGVLLCVFHKKDKPERVRIVVLITAVTVIVLEIYKQIVFSFSVVDGAIEFDYQWYAFPFQFCSTPMYIGLLAGLTKKGKLHDAFSAYLATYAIFAGTCVMLYPNDVFIRTIGIDIQTMVCHGSMISIGIYLLYTQHVKLEHKTILKAMAVFATTLSIAAVLNEIAYYSGLLETESFNMFYISPHVAGSLPVYSLVQQVVPFPFCLIIYILAFSTAAYLILLAAIGIKALFGKMPKISEKLEAARVAVAAFLAEAFSFKRHRTAKILVSALSCVVLFFVIINAIPPERNIQENPFVIEEGEMPMIAAHRGGGDCNPENTLLAFRDAVNTYNVDIIESDLYITKDGFLVYSYAPYIDITSNVNGDVELEEVEELCRDEENRHYIKDMTLEELEQYNFGYYFEDENGDRIYKDVTDPEAQGLQIATLEQLFDEFYETHPELLFILEIKNSGELGYEACEVLNEILAKYPEYSDKVVVGTFHDEIENKLKTKYPEILRGASTSSALSFVITQYLGLNIFDDGDFACLQIPMDCVSIPLDVETLIERANLRNIAVQYWTVNDPEEMRRLIELGVDCIMTDDPELLAQVIEDYKAEMAETATVDEKGADVDTDNETEMGRSVYKSDDAEIIESEAVEYELYEDMA